MARADTITLLSLDRFAEIAGINPAHFNQSYAPSLSPAVFPLNNSCSDVWFQHPWQTTNQISREELARNIYDAEQDIINILGYPVAPMWITEELHSYPRHYNNEIIQFGVNARKRMKSIFAKRKKFIQGGQRGVAIVGTATVAGGTLTYLDNDSDGLFETAQIILPTTLTDECEIKVYFAGNLGNPAWEIRPVKTKAISGGNVTITIDSWKMIDQDLFEQFPDADGLPNTVDISTTANFITSVDVYNIFNDFTERSAQFYWERRRVASSFMCSSCSGSGCPQCDLITQDGCIQARDNENGEVVPVPATYDDDNAQWQSAIWTNCTEPDQVKIWYKAGDISQESFKSFTCNQLSNYWAQTIVWLTIARLNKSFCSCETVNQRVNWLRQDLSRTGGASETFFTPEDLLSNPFGPQRGSVMAWQRIEKTGQRKMSGYAV